jgi:hypothetical protein
MTTSGSTDYTRNALQIITGALRKLRVIDAGTTASGSDLTTGLEALNLMIKAWQLDDVFLWLQQEAVLHLAKDAQSYTLGPSGSHFCAASDAVSTTLTAAAAAGATALTVTSNTGIVASDYVGVELDSGVLYWTTQNGAPAGTTDLTLTAGVTTAAGSGNRVFAYTTKLSRPLDIKEARLRDTDNNDTPIEIERSNDEYFQRYTDKTATGDCQRMHVVPHITNTTVYTWPVCDDVTARIFMTIQRVIEDFDTSTDTADMPPEILEGLMYNLALRLMAEYPKSGGSEDIKGMAVFTYEQIKGKYGRRDPVYLRPPRWMRNR